MRNALDVCHKLPDRGLRQELSPGWHSVGTPLINAEEQIRGRRPVNVAALAQRGAHSTSAIPRMTADAVELIEILHPACRGLRVLTERIVDLWREGDISRVEA